MVVKSKNPEGAKAATDELHKWQRFMAIPLPLPLKEISTEANIKGAIGKQFKKLIDNANVLPQSVKLIQAVLVPPSDTTIDFEIPTAIRQDISNRETKEKILKSAAVIVKHFSRGQNSFFVEANRGLHLKGFVSIISKNGSPGKQSILGGTVDCYRSVVLQKLLLRNLGFNEKSIKDVVDEADSSELSSEEWGFYPALHPESLKRLLDDSIFSSAFKRNPNNALVDAGYVKLLKGKEQAQAQIYSSSPFLGLGSDATTLVMCAPRVFDIGEDEETVGGCGCFFVLSRQPKDDEIDALYLFSHKLATASSAVIAVARKLHRESAVRVVEGISHGLGGTIMAIKNQNGRDQLLKLEQISLTAIPPLLHRKIRSGWVDWDNGGYDETSIGATLRTVYPELDIKDVALQRESVNPIFVAMVSELCRNMSKWSKMGQLQAINNANGISLTVETCCSKSHADGVSKRLKAYESTNEYRPLRGLQWIVFLAEALRSAQRTPLLVWKFALSQRPDPIMQIEWNGALSQQGSIEDVKDNDMLNMTFTAANLTVLQEES